jgi:two-component system response regulator FixJ
VIDDDLGVLQSTGYLLETLGYEVDCFRKPELFIAVAPTLNPGCVLSDLRMPGMNGYELRGSLRALSIEWPVVLVTSETGAEIEREVAERGFAAYIRKPVATKELVAILDNCFAEIARQAAD